MGELGIIFKQPIPIEGDNQGSIFMSANPVTGKLSKHIDIRYHYIREQVVNGKVAIFYIDGKENPADLLTKNLGHIKFHELRDKLGLEFIEQETSALASVRPVWK